VSRNVLEAMQGNREMKKNESLSDSSAVLWKKKALNHMNLNPLYLVHLESQTAALKWGDIFLLLRHHRLLG
jgi:hypothetical protein